MKVFRQTDDSEGVSIFIDAVRYKPAGLIYLVMEPKRRQLAAVMFTDTVGNTLLMARMKTSPEYCATHTVKSFTD